MKRMQLSVIVHIKKKKKTAHALWRQRGAIKYSQRGLTSTRINSNQRPGQVGGKNINPDLSGFHCFWCYNMKCEIMEENSSFVTSHANYNVVNGKIRDKMVKRWRNHYKIGALLFENRWFYNLSMNWVMRHLVLITQSSNSRGSRTPAPIKTTCVWCSHYNEEFFPSLDGSLSWQTSILMSQWPCILSLSSPLTRDFVFQMCKDLWHLLQGHHYQAQKSLCLMQSHFEKCQILLLWAHFLTSGSCRRLFSARLLIWWK